MGVAPDDDCHGAPTWLVGIKSHRLPFGNHAKHRLATGSRGVQSGEAMHRLEVQVSESCRAPGEGPDPMPATADIRCPSCGDADDVTWIDWPSEGQPELVASRCWNCGHLWSSRTMAPATTAPATTADANQSALLADSALGPSSW
jgi:hypothetical protein